MDKDSYTEKQDTGEWQPSPVDWPIVPYTPMPNQEDAAGRERRYALLQAAAIMRSRRDFSAKQAVEEAREMLAMLEAEVPKKP